MALGLIQPLTEMCTRNIHVPIVLKSGRIKLLEPSGPVQACNWIALPLPDVRLRANLIKLINHSVLPTADPIITTFHFSVYILVCGYATDNRDNRARLPVNTDSLSPTPRLALTPTASHRLDTGNHFPGGKEDAVRSRSLTSTWRSD